MAFIGIIVGLLVKEPETLGWDPTMLRFIIDEEHPKGYSLPSYLVKEHKSPVKPLTPLWTVSVEACPTISHADYGAANVSKDLHLQQRFVLYHLLRLSRSEVLRGRATRIWLAWKYEDMGKVQRDRQVCHALITQCQLFIRRLVGPCLQRCMVQRSERSKRPHTHQPPSPRTQCSESVLLQRCAYQWNER